LPKETKTRPVCVFARRVCELAFARKCLKRIAAAACSAALTKHVDTSFWLDMSGSCRRKISECEIISCYFFRTKPQKEWQTIENPVHAYLTSPHNQWLNYPRAGWRVAERTGHKIQIASKDGQGKPECEETANLPADEQHHVPDCSGTNLAAGSPSARCMLMVWEDVSGGPRIK
jgi:hypothetical protein